jgi:hypothetical protein
MIDIILFFGRMALQAVVGQGFLIIKALLSPSKTRHPVGLLWTSDEPDAETYTLQHTTLRTEFYAPGGIRNPNPSKRAAADPCLRPHGHRNRQLDITALKIMWLLCSCMSSMSLARGESFINYSYILAVTNRLKFFYGRSISYRPLFLHRWFGVMLGYIRLSVLFYFFLHRFTGLLRPLLFGVLVTLQVALMITQSK